MGTHKHFRKRIDEMQDEVAIKRIAIVVPCYNEEQVLPQSSTILIELFDNLKQSQHIHADSKIYFIDDGSQDGTWEIIKSLSQSHSSISGIKLSRNYGHQSALLAGLFSAEGDAVISIDADLQDDVNIIKTMIDDFYKGKDIVYGVRGNRDTDSFFKRFSAKLFYKLMIIMGVDLIYNHADFRLMSRRTVEHLMQYNESNLFIRGIIPLIGYPTSTVAYDRTERLAGESKYPLRKMLGFAIDGITSFSITPLRLITLLGILILLLSIVVSIWVLSVVFFSTSAVPGWASTVLPIYFIGGIQLFSLGIIGEYLGKIYLETKKRPRFTIEENTSDKNK